MPAEASRLENTGPYRPEDCTLGCLLAHRYKLREKIGEGGMGEVWVAEQIQPVHRKVAIKLIKPGMDSKAVLARFEAERQALALMDHPHIARVLDGGTTEQGRPFFVMDYVQGVPITQYCDEVQLSVAQRLELFVPVCQAVQHAHQKGIIHRDLKPSNILVCLYDSKPVPKVIDFGLAKALYQPLTEHSVYTAHGMALGTPLYMSPEQAEVNNLDIDTRSDIYSLGVILYELLTGSTPIERQRFKQAAWQEMLRLIKEEEPPRPSMRLSGSGTLGSIAAQRQVESAKLTRLVRGELDWIAMKALAKERSRRYETANGLARDLERYLHDEPVEACPPSVTYRATKLLRRYKGPVLAAAVVLLALVGGLVGTGWGLMRAEQARAVADTERKRAEANEQKALEEKRVAHAVRDFLQYKLLGQADTEAQANALVRGGDLAAAAKYDVTVRELLDRAAAELSPEKIEASFPKQPLLQAEILQTVGATYRGVGEFGQAVSLLQRAAGLRQQQLGSDHPETLTTLIHLARAYDSAGKLPEAIKLLEQVRAASEAKLGLGHHLTVATLNNLAAVYQEAGRLPEAITLYEQVRAASDAKLPDHSDVSTTLGGLAVAYWEAGRVPEAIRLLEQVHAAEDAKLGPDHPSTLTTLNNLAAVYQKAGRLPDAIKLLEEARVAQDGKLGPDHPSTLTTLNNLAAVYQKAGRLPEAITLYEQVRAAREAKLGRDHPRTLTTLNNLAAAHWSAKQLDRSIPLFEDVVKRRQAKLGREHPDTLSSVANLGVNYRDAGRLDEAIPLLEEAYRKRQAHPRLAWVGTALLAAYVKAGKTADTSRLVQELVAKARKQFPSDSLQLADALASVAKPLLSLDHYADADVILRECLALLEKQAKSPVGDASGSPMVRPWQVANAKSVLGSALLGQERYADAEPLLLAAVEGLQKDAKAIPPQSRGIIAEAMDRLVMLYEATGKADEAAKWRKELAAIAKP